MNYRHAFHAGNHADVLKHVVLLAWLDRLLAKEAPVFVLDTHGGRGEYALDDGSAARTGEAAAGIGRLWGLHGLPAAVERLCTAVRAFNGAGELRHYPGSPRLTLAALRPQDGADLSAVTTLGGAVAETSPTIDLVVEVGLGDLEVSRAQA